MVRIKNKNTLQHVTHTHYLLIELSHPVARRIDVSGADTLWNLSTPVMTSIPRHRSAPHSFLFHKYVGLGCTPFFFMGIKSRYTSMFLFATSSLTRRTADKSFASDKGKVIACLVGELFAHCKGTPSDKGKCNWYRLTYQKHGCVHNGVHVDIPCANQ